MDKRSIERCACGRDYYAHPSGKCHECRRVAVAKAVKRARRRERAARADAQHGRAWLEAFESGRPMSEDDR